MKTTIRTLLACLFASLPGLSFASGFGLIEANADGQGTAYAGTGAVAENASTVFFNPAAMILLPGRQVSASLHAIKYVDKYEGGSPDGGDAGGLALLPSFYYAMPISSKLWFGLGVNSPFGLKTEYDQGWVGQTSGIKSDMKTININPSLAWRVNDQLSLGFGLNAMYIKAELTSYSGASTPGTVTLKGDDWGYGYNLGMLYELDKDTRVGLSYRSKVKQKLEGDVSFTNQTSTFVNGPIRADIELPDTATFSFYRKVNPQWTLLADISWTGWSTFQELRAVRTSGALVSSTQERWKDTMRYSVGAHYQWTERTKLRMGVGFDESPVSDQYRTVRIPDSDRTWVAFGMGYKLNKDDNIDLAYSHLFLKDAPISTPAGNYNHNTVDILGVQYTHTF